MESTSSHEHEIIVALETLRNMSEACDYLLNWNEGIDTSDDYLTSAEGVKLMAASCMLIEALGEETTKLDKLLPGFLQETRPDIEWKGVKGMRDHIAHGYFNINAMLVFATVKDEIAKLKDAVEDLKNKL